MPEITIAECAAGMCTFLMGFLAANGLKMLDKVSSMDNDPNYPQEEEIPFYQTESRGGVRHYGYRCYI